jgi:hypothetical protein
MRKLTPRRRLAVLAASTAAIAASLPILLPNTHLPDFVRGSLVGIPIGICILLFVRSRRAC